MSRGRSVKKLLLDSSQAALFAGIEIHNKPHIDYRYQTVVILIINAWELALKAYIYKYIGKKRIYEKDGKHTISFSKAIVLVRDDLTIKCKGNEYRPLFDNLNLLNEYRCSSIHYYESKLDAVVFMLISKSVLNYDQFMKNFLNKDITQKDNLIILPVGFKLPFDPIEYLKQNNSSAHNEFVNSVIQSVRKLNQDSIQDSIIIGFDVYTSSIKKVQNADIIAAIDQNNSSFKIEKSVRLTDDPNAPVMRVEPPLLPLSYDDLRVKIKEKSPDIKFNSKFNQILKIIKNDITLCQTRYLDPKKKNGAKKDYYSEKAIDKVIQLFYGK